MNNRPLVPLFAATLFLSAFLIFAIQPMAGKMLLPLLGGGPSVWNTAMVFFQGVLLAGYAYAHILTRFLSLKAQGAAHVVLLIAFAFVLPMALPDGAAPPDGSGQAWWQMGAMMASIGGPFFILAASAPLFQYWFSASGHEEAEHPYFLYAVSNAGSMAALLLYPVLIEPFLTLGEQGRVWTAGYVLLAVFAGVCAYMVKSGVRPIPLTPHYERGPTAWRTRLTWMALAFIPSSLMLGVTTIITTDLASAPFVWLVPLALYLLTFIIAFSRRGTAILPFVREMTGYVLCFVVLAFMVTGMLSLLLPLIMIHLIAFFFCALLCHMELARKRPAPSRLTEYFLLISLGGVLGGAFNALLAPQIFLIPLEYPLALCLVAVVLWRGAAGMPALQNKFQAADDPKRPAKLLAIDGFTALAGVGGLAFVALSQDNTVRALGMVGVFVFLFLMVGNRSVFAVTIAAALFLFEPSLYSNGEKYIARDRNYFGILKVSEKGPVKSFYHGTTLHGSQRQDGNNALVPTSYYSKDGPTGDVFKNLKKDGQQRVAALGLGIGSIACYAAPGRRFDFYEIDADVVKFAQDPHYFSYLSDCGSDYNIILGDARRKIAAAENASYDLIFVDTFSSDNIPVHIMTKEALALYMTKLAPGGVIAINISNRYLDLEPVLNQAAKEMGLSVYFKSHTPARMWGEVSMLFSGSSFAVIGADPQDTARFVENFNWQPYMGKRAVRAWTDDYANILSAMTLGN